MILNIYQFNSHPSDFGTVHFRFKEPAIKTNIGFSFIEACKKKINSRIPYEFCLFALWFFSHAYRYFTYLLLLYLSLYTLPKNFPLKFPNELSCNLRLPYTFLPPSDIFTSVLLLPNDVPFFITLLRSFGQCFVHL